MFDIESMLNVLPKALLGWLGVFIVIGVLVLAVSLMNRFVKDDEPKS